ncbi:hypothetical protein PBY51_017466 [Eleginops maclovinus]|uniref:THD domain-containing protein n=1 Tax=Eleginops maclovinus TaxID=56733 RepID=A0AAN8AJ96_ELEMC|nr:hypothetical protein PBY51_017466 [Eleginops maclovinus]
MNLGFEIATHTRMEGHSGSSHKYLQVWCSVLTVAMVVMAAFLISVKQKSTGEEVSTVKPDNASPINPTVNSIVAPFGSIRSTRSFIQLIKDPLKDSWKDSPPSSRSSSLFLRNDSIHFKESSTYFIYAQGTFPETTVSSVWLAKIVSLSEGDSISLNVTAEFGTDSQLTFWGAIRLS